MAAPANRPLLAKVLSMSASETEQPLPSSTFRTVAPDHALEVTARGTCVMLDGHLKTYCTTDFAREQPERVMIIGVAMGSDAASGKGHQI
jgi:hypothetical protein